MGVEEYNSEGTETVLNKTTGLSMGTKVQRSKGSRVLYWEAVDDEKMLHKHFNVSPESDNTRLRRLVCLTQFKHAPKHYMAPINMYGFSVPV